jgi:hypothetical protein
MIDLKIAKKKKNKEVAIASDESGYPYGTRLRFETEEVKKIKSLKSANVGQSVKIEAVGKVVSVSISKSEDDKYHSVEIQIEKIDLDMPGDEEDSFNS